ncbi:uncharacterized protein LOC129595879 [Paramacrobiotus metropolitanus]|uniref:uncharacterized protein LOC129595879 n=1 Tax=Paramacrobiotus metropolitanus TaxID=2943436 RepID=UPI002445DFE8|nr:uncharacterized protein LOC129595879 [Paramacrobiotus metropolitanus]
MHTDKYYVPRKQSRLTLLSMIIILTLQNPPAAECLVDDFESECSEPAATQTKQVQPSEPTVTFPFRTDGLTRAEFCIRFAKETSCSQVMFGSTYKFDNCYNASDSEIRAHPWGHFIEKTYIDFNCPSQGREHMTAITKAISGISPTRALTIALYDKADERWLAIHSDVIEPVRNQVIQLSALFCESQNITAKVHAMGMLPNVLRFQLGFYCHGLIIRKADFSRMPQVRVIQFISSTTIAEMEPYTFTDLNNLQILTLEAQIANDMYSRAENDHGYARGSLPDHVFQHTRRLHCDCSFAWFRNFLKKKPYLTAAMKEGELMTVGSFKLPESDIRAPGSSANVTALTPEELGRFSVSMLVIKNEWSPVLSVNCAQPFDWRNTQAGNQFSYNTSCYNMAC